MRTTRRARLGLLSLCLAATTLGLGSPAAAATTPADAGAAAPASLVQVTDFGYNPSDLGMYLYVPNSVTSHPAILVAAHYCGGTGPAFYASTPFAALADQYGFIVIYPSVTRSTHCFDVASAGALRHNGNSDPAGVVSMVRYVERHYHADPGRVYATGLSSGAMLTNVQLGDFPDVFAAGAAFAGVPFGCFATSDPSGWNSQCATGQISKTPQQWGDLVRAADPGYHGARPRMQLWHGTEDTTLAYPNFGEEIKQWTDVAGLSQTPTSTDSPLPTWPRTRYADATGRVDVEAISIQGATHNLPVFAPSSELVASAVRFFGLSDGVPLRLLAERDGKYFGTALTVPNLSDPRLTAVAGKQFDMVTPGNEMKWDTTEPANGVFDFGPGDQIVAFARQHGDRVRGHNLVWHSQLPAWVSALPADQVRAAMETHISTEVSHYRGQIYAWDVVNEPFNEDGTLRQTVFYNAMGPGYLADAIRTAHAADPRAKLYLNDYNIEGINPKSDAMYNLVKSLKQQGVPIGGVGLESHFILGKVPTTMLEKMSRFAALGVDGLCTNDPGRMLAAFR